MQVKLLAFAQAADHLGFRECVLQCTPSDTPRAILSRLAPLLDVTNLRVALDHEYCAWDQPIREARELALIPPVSGG